MYMLILRYSPNPAYNFKGVHRQPSLRVCGPRFWDLRFETLSQSRGSRVNACGWLLSPPHSFTYPTGLVSAQHCLPVELAPWTAQQLFPRSRGNSPIPLSKSYLSYWFSPLEGFENPWLNHRPLYPSSAALVSWIKLQFPWGTSPKTQQPLDLYMLFIHSWKH